MITYRYTYGCVAVSVLFTGGKLFGISTEFRKVITGSSTVATFCVPIDDCTVRDSLLLIL
jgi:hypothetical protein